MSEEPAPPELFPLQSTPIANTRVSRAVIQLERWVARGADELQGVLDDLAPF